MVTINSNYTKNCGTRSYLQELELYKILLIVTKHFLKGNLYLRMS